MSTSSPQLRAAISDAAKAADDFGRETTKWIAGTGEQPLWQSWARALHTRLRMLLKALEATSEGTTT